MESTYFRCSTPSKSCQGQFNNITSILPRFADELNFTKLMAYSFTVVITIRGRHERYPGTHQNLKILGTAGYWVPRKFQKLGSAGHRKPRKFQKLGTAGYRVPSKFQKMGTAGYRVPRKF